MCVYTGTFCVDRWIHSENAWLIMLIYVVAFPMLIYVVAFPNLFPVIFPVAS